MDNIINKLLEMAEQNKKGKDLIKSEKWNIEPDCVELETSDDYHLVIWRNPNLGTLNGYVGINRSHPFFALNNDKKQVRDLEVHWGTTYAAKIREMKNFKKKYWYIGFDTSHCDDFAPYTYELFKKIGYKSAEDFKKFGTYKDIPYVIEETVNLYNQLKSAKLKDKGYVHSFKKEYKLLRQIKKEDQRLQMMFS
jgi:hypothetical protein